MSKKRPNTASERTGSRGVGYRIKVLAQLTSRHFQYLLDPYDLTPFHWVVLNCLWETDGLAVSVIGEQLQQVGGTMTGVIDRMEERGLIRRERDKEDRRIWRIWLTDKGRKLGKELPPIMSKARDRFIAGVPESDYETFITVLEKLIANVRQMIAQSEESQ